MTQHEPYPAYRNIQITFGWPQVEAELLFREFANYPGDLVHFSYKISDTINAATDAIVAGSPTRASFAFIAVAVPPVLVVIVLRVLNLCVGGTLCTPCGVAPLVSVRLI
jgi:hypothetical protein